MVKIIQISLLLILNLLVSPPVLADGLRGADWFVQKNEHSNRKGDKLESVNVSDRNIPSESIGALIRQGVASMQIRLDKIKIKLKNGNFLDRSDKEFLKEVSGHQSLSKYIDSELWVFIAKGAETGERWAEEIITLSGRRVNSFANENIRNAIAHKSRETLDASGIDVVEEGGDKRIVSKYNGITQSVLSGFKGPDYSSFPVNVLFFSPEGFNFEQPRFRRDYVPSEKNREYEKKIFERRYVENHLSDSLQNVPHHNDLNDLKEGIANSSLEAIDPNIYITKILDDVTAGLSKGERGEIESSVTTLLETAQGAAGERVLSSNDEEDKNGEETLAEVRAATGGASAHR